MAEHNPRSGPQPRSRPGSQIAAAALSLHTSEFNALRGVIKARLGIHISAQKRVFLEGRLGKMLRERGLSLERYLGKLRAGLVDDELRLLADCVSVNHTYFYREPVHFEFFSHTVLPELSRRAALTGQRRMRVWCAATATGQEAYTLAMLEREHLGAAYEAWDAGVLATDISVAALESASKGVYDAADVVRLPVALKKYFEPYGAGRFRVSVAIRQEVLCRTLNLVKGPWAFRGGFDVIFCRNVLIYFDARTKAKVIGDFYRALRPGGYLFVGMAEGLSETTGRFEPCIPSVYRRL